MIPKTIHKVWLGPKPMPEQFSIWQKQLVELHPEWAFRWWNNHIVRIEFPGYYDQIIQMRSYSEMSDVIRWLVLQKYGGVYMDTDFEIWASLDPLSKVTAWAGLYHDTPVKQTYPLPGICGFEPWHGMVNWCLEETLERANRVKHGLLEGTSGEIYGTILHDAWHRDIFLAAPITLLPPEFFYPIPNYPAHDKIVPPDYRQKGRFGAHHWAGSWVEKS